VGPKFIRSFFKSIIIIIFSFYSLYGFVQQIIVRKNNPLSVDPLLNININIKEDVQTIIPIFMADVMTTT